MKCNNCGAENANGARFCFNCGSTIVTDPQPPVQIIDQTQDIPQIQPQYDYDQPQYASPQSEYVPESTQYGYGQPQYGYEQPQYGYEQPATVYEQPVKPEKSGKKGAVVAVLIVVLLLVVLGVFGFFAVKEGWIVFNFNFSESEPAKVETVVEEQKIINLGPEIAGPLNVFLEERYIAAGAVKPSKADANYTTPLQDDPNSKYFVVVVSARNVSNYNILFNNLYYDAILKTDKEYPLKDRLEIYYESADGTSFTDNSIIKSGESRKIYFVCSLPNGYFEEYTSYSLTFGYDSEFSDKPLTKGKDACDYIFNFVAG